MPLIQTKYFGCVEYPEESVIEFPSGLPGFENERRFVILEQPENKPLVFLQSLSLSSLCFLALPVLTVDPGYQTAISPEDLAALELPKDRQPLIGRDVLCLALVSLAEGRPPTANLLAPLVVHLKTRRGLQAIQSESGYSHQHPLLEGTC
jgi:flagellar assembly factor FliW